MRRLPRAARTTTTIGKYLCRRPSDNLVSRYLQLIPTFMISPMRNPESKGKWATHERRTSTKLIRFSPDELELVINRARSASRPVACYIRESSLGPAPRARRAGLNDAVIRTLSQLATRLSLLATEAKNHHLAQADEFQQSVSEVLDVIREIE